MLSGTQHLKIQHIVVVSDVIDVVDVLIRSQGSPQLLFHEPAMFGHPATLTPTDLDLDIPIWALSAASGLDTGSLLFVDHDCGDDLAFGILCLPAALSCRLVAVPRYVARIVDDPARAFRDVWLDLLPTPTPT